MSYLDITQRAELGVDGNCGFALCGPNLQAGEAEFVEITAPGDTDEILRACKKALNKLRGRLNAPNMSYHFGPSHPYGE